MKVIKIDKNDWASGLLNLSSAYRLFGPVKEDDNTHNFKELKKGDVLDFDFSNTHLSPKSSVFPQSEIMLEFTTDGADSDNNIMKEVQKDYSEKAFIGIRPCDAKAVSLVKMNFDTPEYKDPYWLKAYNATVFIGLACDNPASECFCTSVGCGPYNEEGLDVLLVDLDDYFIAKAISEKGEKFIDAGGWSKTVDTRLIEEQKIVAESKITSKINTNKLRSKDTLQLYNAKFWEEASFACINCGTCTFACPTCWCFDIQDETYGKDGVRIRNWDSCMFPLFTVHTTGHNPRGTKLHRVRQRFMHKLKYFVDKYDKGTMCVGCGRCVKQCPVNIDIRNICEKMNSHEPAN